jgi:quinohemoprotein ethanol dehydrogenase
MPKAARISLKAAGLLLALTFGMLSAEPQAAKQTTAPAFTAKQLSQLPRDAWITNGGNIANQRYSPLTQINPTNVKNLKANWRTHLGSGMGSRNSAQAQPLFWQGVLYVTTGDNDVLALDVETGKILWTHHGRPNPKAGAPVGWSNRGVAMGDGRIYASQIDAKLLALDQKTGRVIWEIQAEKWEEGFSITSAPLYYNGLVITGFSGGEYGTRGRVKAYDAKTGKLVWTFYTIPGPGEIGHETWPQGSDIWKHGGAPVWQTPAVDPDLGLVYFSTGNPGPDFNGDVRKGDNLFSVAIVAVDVKTGKYKWHFQQVHHDIWDYDSPNPIVLFDAVVKGQPRKGLVQVSKTGWAYILDRATGEPLIGIEERPVPQEPRQATAATQPYPIGDAIVPQEIDIAPQDLPVVNGGRIFTPFWTQTVAMKPASIGGANWPPSSYDPEKHILYVCATDRMGTFSAAELEGDGLPEVGEVYMAGRLGTAQADDRGIFAALDVTTNRLVWRRQWIDICYSGSIVTAGGIIFTGRNDGRFVALDKADGDQLWDFQTDAGVNTAASTFEWKGEQYVAILSGGATFANSAKGDSLWLFSLKGTMGPTPPPAPPPPSRGGPPRAAAAPARTADLARGEIVYRDACLACHGRDGDGGVGGGSRLTASRLDAASTTAVITNGRNSMPAFAGTLSSADIQDVSAYVLARLVRREAQ